MTTKHLSLRSPFKRLSRAFRPSPDEQSREAGYTPLISTTPSTPSPTSPGLPNLPELEGSSVPNPILNVQPPTPQYTPTQQQWTDFPPLSDILQPPLSHPAWSERPFMRDFQSSPQLPPARRWSHPCYAHPAGVGVQLVAELSVACRQARHIEKLKARVGELRSEKKKKTVQQPTKSGEEVEKTADDHRQRKRTLKSRFDSALSLTTTKYELYVAKTELAQTQQRLAETRSRNERLGTFLGVLNHRVAALEEERRGLESGNATVVVECGAGAAGMEGGG